MKYQIVLTSVLWGPDYQNARRFGSRAAQEAYFDVANKFTASVPVRNLDYANFTRLSVLVKTGQAGIGDIMSANYAIIKDVTNANSPKYWYYFITNSTFDSVDQTRLELQMDVIQSYYIDMTFGESMIERAHLNRWTGNYLSNAISSQFWAREELRNLPKHIKSFSNCTTSPFAATNNVSKWLDQNVDGWLYAFFDKGNYTFDGQTPIWAPMAYTTIRTGTNSSFVMYSPYIVVCCPIMANTSKSIKVNTHEIKMSNFMKFVNDNIAHVYTIKVSQFSPFTIQKQPTCTINGDVLEITSSVLTPIGTNDFICAVNEQTLGVQYLTYKYSLPQAEHTKTAITTYAKDKNANPKIFNDDYCGLKILYGGNDFEFDIQKLYSARSTSLSLDIDFVGFELLTAEIAPTFITYEAGGVTDAAYSTNPKYNLLGYLAKNDFSLPYSTSQLETFLANNKNFFLQKQEQYNTQKAQRAVSGISNLLSSGAGIAAAGVAGDVGGMAKQAFGSLLGLGANILSSEIQINYDKANTSYTLDNMQAGIDSLRNANGNAFFNFACNDLRIVIQHLESIEQDKERALEDMYEHGYVYNRMGNIKDFDNIRSNWNYIKARVEIILTPVKIPNEVRNTIKQIFANGIRFWNTDTWNYNQTNLEN